MGEITVEKTGKVFVIGQTLYFQLEDSPPIVVTRDSLREIKIRLGANLGETIPEKPAPKIKKTSIKG